MATTLESKSLSSTDGPITLHFQDITRVAGETIHGRSFSILYFESSKITTSVGGNDYDHYASVYLVNTDMALWAQGGPYPEPGSHILSLPFQFQFPETLPPSFHCWSYHRHSNIGYSLEVVGTRTGFFRINRRIRRLISVVPAASQEQLLAKESLRQGWNGPWRDITWAEKLRKGIWGEYSHARLTIPAMGSFPIATDIPFRLHVETETKLMHVSDAPVDKHGKPLFPAPPALSSDVKLVLHRRAEIRVRQRTRHVEDIYDLEGSLGDAKRVAAVHQVIDEPEWIPAPGSKDEKGRGIWRRAVHFESAVAIPYAPTTNTEILDWEYNLRFIVPFPGIGNDLQLEVPIRLDPGSACPPLPVGTPGSSNMTYADVLPAGPPPPMLDLPPSYWAGDHHAWDVDDKKG
ncbi:hypothetical protein DFH06DRAFT_1431857 [Mycena polygramma]|nr:hypothetical protein DFH06DRAFT_1431857 [Mycena polygramma]